MLTAAGFPLQHQWNTLWASEIGKWLLNQGLRIVIVTLSAVLIIRFLTWGIGTMTRRLDREFAQSEAVVRSEATKHRQAVASVVLWTLTALVVVGTGINIAGVLNISLTGFAFSASVVGAALGFGAQRIVQDLLSGFFIITEKQYGFGDLVELYIQGQTTESTGTVEDVTLRVTKLRSTEGAMMSIPNGLIVKSTNLSRDWARAIIDIPVPTTVDLARVNDVLHDVCQQAVVDPTLAQLLLDPPSLMGVENIEVGRVNLRLVARTLPGKQFDVGRRIRAKVVAALAQSGVALVGDSRPTVTALAVPTRKDSNDNGPGESAHKPESESAT